MSIERKYIYTGGVLLLCVVLLTCTKVSFEDPFTGENAKAVPIITLIGPDPYYLNIGDTYYEPGATAIDTSGDETIDITDSIEPPYGSVSTDSPDNYWIKYYVTGLNGIRTKKERKVIVEEIDDSDQDKPVIKLKGLNPTILFIDETYTEKGATANDDNDGDLTDKIEIYGEEITTQEQDSFEVWYMVSDNAGNVAREKREVWIWEGVDRDPPILTLNGKEKDTIYIYDDYSEPGAEAWDEVDGDLTGEIVVIDSLDNTIVGIFPIHYRVSDKSGNLAEKTRYIWVLDRKDTIPPVITLLGDVAMKVGAGGNFQDPGATAIDNKDGDISNRIKDSGSVDMQEVGTYKIYYNVQDGAGNKAEEKIRTVEVVDTIPPVITINPPNPINIFVGAQYHEWGATAYDNLDGDITLDIDTVGFVDVNTNDSVDVSKAGEYRVHYRVTDNAGFTTDSVRYVNVSDSSDSKDTVSPIISLKGDNPMILNVNETYNEPGATAHDNKDGDVTSKIDVTNDFVETSSSGVYRIHYNVSDEAGNETHEIRSVYVGVTPPRLD